MMAHCTKFTIKIFNLVHICGRDMGIAEHMRTSRKFIAFILRTILKHHPTYRTCDARKDFKAQYGVTLKYHKIWWGKELAQNELYGLARHSYDCLR